MSKLLPILLLASLFLVSCHVNPVTNRPQVMITSRGTEKEIGDQQAAQVEATIGLVAEPALNAYITAIGERLVRQAPDEGYEFRFHVVNMEEPNAFALPGGSVYVSRGLLMLANSEDEVAGVIGHEIAHVLGRDSGSRISLAAPLSIATGIGALATGIVSPALGHLVGGIGGLTQGLLLSPHDRQQERNADAYALKLAGAAGWQPQALSEILHSLERYEDLQGESERALSFFASHPRTPERVRDTARAAAAVETAAAAPIAASQRDFFARLDGMVIGDDPGFGVFVDSLFVQPDMRIAMRFPPNWETHNAWNQVVAVAPKQQAMAVLTHGGEGDDPMKVARDTAARGGVDSSGFKEVEVNGLRAVRSGVLTGRSDGRATAMEATWIAHGGNVYQVVCATTPDRLQEFRDEFEQTPGSFRVATDDDVGLVRAQRLRIHRAAASETLTALLKRVGSSWDTKTAAVANDVDATVVFAGGEFVKAAVEEAYRPR